MTFTPHPSDSELDLELVRDVPVSPRAVFNAWTDPESLKQWFAPRPYSISLVEVDLRPGGGFRTVMNDPDGNQMMDETGCYLEVVPDKRLVWTTPLGPDYRPQPAGDMPFTAILELTDNGSGGCIYRAIAVHQDPAGAKAHADMGFHDGWGTVVDQLVEHIQGS
ncbi:MAG: SRPBCC family protein [Microthrixaceae bacterium]